jgi:hypothetical protein
MKKLLLAGVAIGAFAVSGSAFAAFPGFANNPDGPEFLITFSDSGVTTMVNPNYATDPGPYDGADDTYFGVINNSSTAITHFALSSTAGADIGGFDGDGIDEANYLNITHNVMDTSGYGGPNAFFTNNLITSLTVNFITPIAAMGGTDIFSLEEAVALNSIVVGTPEPSTWVMMLAGFAGMGFLAYRKRGAKTTLSAA